jgi:hypothetical protein
MKKLLPLILLAMLLSACPDAKIPKPPPKVPEPKLLTSTFYTAPASVSHGLGLDLTMLRPA